MTTTARSSGTKARPAPSRTELEVCIGRSAIPAGKLVYTVDGRREFSQFAYAEQWLADDGFFSISPDLQRTAGYQLRKAPTANDSSFFLALADTEPDAWGRRVIARAHAKQRKADPSLGSLTQLDYLCAVDDFSRVGAIRLRAYGQTYLDTVEDGSRSTPPLLELEHVIGASRRVEMSTETGQDLQYLQGKGTSLGGMRPKCTLIDTDGALALGKFPSINDDRSVTRGEVLALKLAGRAGIDVADSRIEQIQDTPVAIVRRFDRTAEHGRIPYISGATLLQANRDDEHSYEEVVDQMRSHSADFTADARQLWRRIVFNHLITNVDDHLQNIGFLYVGKNMWKLAPAFDLNPFPDKARESKTWLSERSGPVTSVAQLLAEAANFQLKPEEAVAALGEIVRAVGDWRRVATSPEVGLGAKELPAFADAFEHDELKTALALAH